MNKQQLKTSCNSHRLELFLQGRLNSSETEILELHLTECESCARQIQLNAEQGVSWNEAQSLLTPDEYDSPQHIAAISSLLSDEHDPMTKHQTADVLSREIRGWLDPTDDPRSMGRFAGYEIVGIVGHGGMGIVLKGFEASLNRYVAIKILAPRLATNGSARKRFAREAQAAAAVRHDNVIAIHRVDEWHSLPFLVMPYAGGISLQKRIDSDGPLSIEQTLRVGVQIASGLAAAHAQGLIHRDIKPANILLEQGVERVTITDFGLARAADDASVTRTGVIAGTPQYMSPEQAEAKQLDARSDLFSLGSVLYAMATGRPPFRGAGSFEVLKRIVNEPARPMREIESSVPEWFENIVNRLLSKSPGDRPSSASEVAALLQECLAHVQQPTTTLLPESLTAVATSDNRNRRRPIGKFIAIAAFAFSLIFAGVLIVLELNKGTLTIECEADDVPIRIMQGDVPVKQLTISRRGATTRLQAGNYTVEVDGDSTAYEIIGNQVTLRRGENPIVRIGFTEAGTDSAAIEPHPELGVLQLKGSAADVKAALETLSRLETSEPGRSEKAKASSDDEVSRLLSEIDFLNKREERGGNSRRSVRYGAGVMRLASFGSAAVPRIIEELDRTDDARMIATLAYVLRAIGDKRGVPALIRAIPRTYVPQDDCNWIQSTNVIDKELIAFFRQHKFEGQGDAAIGCSNAMTELSMTLSSLTGAKFALTYTYCRGTPLQIYLQKKLVHKDAERWGKWWEQNCSNMVDDVAYRKAGVPEFNMNSPGIVNPNQTLTEVAWEITYELKSLRGATAANVKYPIEFLDLDTGRNSPAPEQWRDKQLSDADVANLLAWAANEGFDLTCDQHEIEDGTRHYVVRGIGLKAWQLDEKSWKDDVLCKWGELATAGRSVVDDWLIPFVREKGVLDPAGKAPFLVVTREGSPVMIYVGAEITDVSPKSNDFLSFDSLDDHVGSAKGRKLGIQLFEIAQLEVPPGADDPSTAKVEEAKDVGVSVPPTEFDTLEDFLKPGDDKPQAPDQPSMSKTLQQLQGKWRLTRQIAADGDEKITPANTTWEFKGPRIVARDGGPGGVMLIELDESHSPVHVDVALEGADESGLGLLSIEDDKLILCLGVSQKKRELRSRPEKLQWVSGVWYMELQRVKPDETIEPVKPNPLNATATVSQTAINEAGDMPSDKTSAPTAGDAAHTISGFVMEFRSGTPDVPVCLCDAATGMPVAKDTYKPIVWSRGADGNPADEMAIVVSDSKGNFRFENVPDGKYRLIAQKWMGPYKGVFELHGAEIRLLGAVDEITVPRPADDQEARVVPTPLGENTIQFNQDVGNNETFLFLSTSPPEFDPILGLQGLGTSFWKNLIGVNRMPLGKTTVIGSPNKPVYAFMIAPDNSPGFAAITIPPPESGLVRLPAEPFVAGWSDGRKTPPPKLAELIEFMKTHELSVQQLLNIPEMSNANFKVYQARMQELTSDPSRTVELPEGKSARVGDLLAADAYRKLQK